jgi:hypothetical protein
MRKSVERAPVLLRGSTAGRLPNGGSALICSGRVGQKRNVYPGRPKRDGLFLKIDLRSLVVGVRECADEQESHRG